MKPFFTPSMVEPLEARIAPATIIQVGNTLSTVDTEYSDLPFVKTSLLADNISKAVGGDANTYYIKLSAGDKIQQFTPGSGYQDFLVVTKGTVIAFFEDRIAADGGVTNEVELGELQGLALGANVSLQVLGPVGGDIVTNYNDATGSLDYVTVGGVSHLIGPKQGIAQISVGGIQGSILSGGSIAKLAVNGTVTNVLAGSAADGQAFDFLPGIAGGDGTITYAPATSEAGASISNAQIQSLTLLKAGSGGASGKGGSLAGISILQDTDGFVLQAGRGGDGIASKTVGGLGGAVSNVYISGSSDTTSNSAGGASIFAGDGGTAFAGGKGGVGGKLSNVFVGFDSVANKPSVSSGISRDSISIAAGRGGDGDTGGAGGALSAVKVRVQVADAAGNEISVRAGDGGKGVSASKGGAGAGGSISTADISNLDLAYGADTLVQAGNGGINNTPGVSKGANGGSITGTNLIGFDVTVLAGNGSAGTKGGVGGGLTRTHFLQFDSIRAENVTASAGFGGAGGTGAGGNGGSISDFRIDNADLISLTVNGGAAANGGLSTSSKGGIGGSVTSLDVTDTNTALTVIEGAFVLRSGNGGDGGKGGGKGGVLQKGVFTGQDISVTATSGNGGNVTAGAGGVGGAGGLITNFNFTPSGSILGVPATASITSGTGGNGAVKGAGGAGGDVKIVNVKSAGNVSVIAGNGGNGVAAVSAAGKGGGIISVGAFADFGNGLLKAGDGGATGGKAAAGGSVQGASASQVTALRASGDVSILAGNGTNGGAGGNVVNAVFGSTSASLRPTPGGNVLVQAGTGSALGSFAGNGGSISGLTGNPSSGAGKTTQIIAGDGGGVAGGTKEGLGGSITNVAVSGVGDDAIVGNNTVIVVAAGNAGTLATVKTGAKGGDVKIVAFNNLDPDTTIRSIAAGNGGAGSSKGGLGGSLDNVRAVGGLDATTGKKLSGDFGFRSGQVYGYGTMGGLFAGVGGAGTILGLNGNVTNISADSIASIVAGKGAAPLAVEKVEKITLNGLNHLQTISNGDFQVTDGTHTTALLPANATPEQVESALLAAGVDANVIRTTSATYQITFNTNGGKDQLTASEFIPVEVVGAQNFSATEIVPGTDVESESQSYTPLATGTYTLTLYGLETSVLAANADNVAVQNAINALLTAAGQQHETIDPDTGLGTGTFVSDTVTVVGDPTNGFTINFDQIAQSDQTGFRPVATIEAFPTATQNIDLLKAGKLVLNYNGGTLTDPLDVPPEGASPMTIQDFQNAVDSALDAKVGAGVTSVSVIYDPVKSSLAVTFGDPTKQEVLAGFNILPLNFGNPVDGTATTKEIQTLSFVPRAVFSAADYAQANVVGAIVDATEIGAPTFKFTKGAGNVGAGFERGDLPIDGLIVAHIFNQATVNFVPEARLIDGDFFDFDNKI